MKTLIIVVLTLSLVGCATNQPILLKSVVGTRDIITSGTSLSMAKHPSFKWTTLGYGQANDLAGFLSSEDIRVNYHLIAGGGVMFQPDLTPDWQLGPFLGLSTAGSYSDVSFVPDGDSRKKLDAASVEYSNSMSSFEFEASIKPGLVGKFFIGTLSAYGLGYMGAEYGAYSEFRRRNDGVGNLYNIDANPVSLGYGAGVDLQLGSADIGSVGVLIDYLWTYNKTQSYQNSSISTDGKSYVVEVVDGGVMTYGRGPTFGAYAEIKNLKISASLAVFALSNIQLSYRW